MKLIKCPKCNHVIDIDGVVELSKYEIIGCGKKEDNFMPCCECVNENDSGSCELTRKSRGLTKTLVGDMVAR